MRWAQSISAFFRRRLGSADYSVPANRRAMSLAASRICRVIVRAGRPGQHLSFSGQAEQSDLLAQ
ncbi:hypothetical protein D1122_08390 [Cereibacter sphaeroides]|nr:hypothetical protein D1122_08390 [Cereibacter sphaeroides]